jgi:outer membrane protein assembly factor BamE (lipoprotein component of BamABCDE complex)
MGSIIPAIFVLLILSGCFYQGRNFDISPVRNIRNDMTTQREIYADFGEPLRRGLENGLETWVYGYQYYELGQLRESKDLYVVFNKNNTVRSYSFTSR